MKKTTYNEFVERELNSLRGALSPETRAVLDCNPDSPAAKALQEIAAKRGMAAWAKAAQPMTPELAIERLKECQKDDEKDRESAHLAADMILCDLLIHLGHEEVVMEWELVGKWYA